MGLRVQDPRARALGGLGASQTLLEVVGGGGARRVVSCGCFRNPHENCHKVFEDLLWMGPCNSGASAMA